MARRKVFGQSERLAVGAVVLVRLDTGEFGCLQYACPGWFAPVVRVLPGTLRERPEGRGLRRLVEAPTLFVTEFDVDGLIASRQAKMVGSSRFRSAIKRCRSSVGGPLVG